MKLPFVFDEETWGEVVRAEEIVAGVFELAVRRVEDIVSREVYVVLPCAVPAVISYETISYGTPADGTTVFIHEKDWNGWELVDYELKRHKTRLDPSEANKEELFSGMVYTAEKYPAYFGGLIPPRCTPWGLTLRVKTVAEGVYFLETDSLEWVLAVANMIWDVDLSDASKRLGCLCEQDRQMRRREAQYLYFQKKNWGPVVYELLEYPEYQRFLEFISSKEALETQIYLQHPEYALCHNQAQATGNGKSDMLTNLLVYFGEMEESDEEASEEVNQRRMACCIHYYPDHVNDTVFLLPE